MQGSNHIEKIRRPPERGTSRYNNAPRREVDCPACRAKFVAKKGKTTYCPKCGIDFTYY